MISIKRFLICILTPYFYQLFISKDECKNIRHWDSNSQPRSPEVLKLNLFDPAQEFSCFLVKLVPQDHRTTGGATTKILNPDGNTLWFIG